MKKVTILGATGSVGKSTLDLIERHPDRYEVAALTAASNVAALAEAARRTRAKKAVIADETKLDALREALSGSGIQSSAGSEALCEVSRDGDWIMAAIVGCAGLRPVMAAVAAGKIVALANKEALVTAGSLITVRRSCP
jgi:1-deoxy-D-xylulose-5-phosphate reductoisomerase